MIRLGPLLGGAGAVPVIEIVDVGAMEVEGIVPPYAPLLADPGVARLTGFEPVPEECAKLNQRAAPGRRFLPYFVGDGTEGVFRTCDPPMTSSLYEPNLDLCARFFALSEVMRVVKREPVQTVRLDDMPELGRIDYLKMDIQGGELNALRGGDRLLRDTLVIDLEVEFVPLYRDQPLFADVDRRLRELGFLFHGFPNGKVAGRSLRPLNHPTDALGTYGQVLWADALYVRDFTRLDRLSPEQLLQIAVIMNDAYSAPDFAAHALQERDRRTGSRTCEPFMAEFMRAYVAWYNQQRQAEARAQGRPPDPPEPMPPPGGELRL